MKYIFTLVIVLQYLFSFSQVSSCEILPSRINSNRLLTRSNCFNFSTNYDASPIITINVNVQYVNNRFPTFNEAADAIRKFIDDTNEYLATLQQYNLPGPNGSLSAHVLKAKFQLKLYSDATEPTDIYGGIWITNDAYPWLTGSTPPLKYGDKVLNIMINDINTTTSPTCDSNGYVFGIGNTDDNILFISNLYCRHVFNLTKTSTIGVLCHEMFHIFGLYHTYMCDNDCRYEDIKIESECRSRCPNIQICANSGSGCGRDGIICGGTDQICNCFNSSNNMMTQGGGPSITPCQWKILFNKIFTDKPKYAFLCQTMASFTLPTSPLNEYRATSFIASTSVIQGQRKVDYWSQDIRLNTGFEVKRGTAFLASPSSFPCCPTPMMRNSNITNTSGNTVLSNSDILKVSPNPFDESVIVEYKIENNDTNGQITIYDINGKVIKVLPLNVQSKGDYQVEIKTNELPEGVYIIHYGNDANSVSKKIIKTYKK
jgi:Secretion system C-terminal sorting domain